MDIVPWSCFDEYQTGNGGNVPPEENGGVPWSSEVGYTLNTDCAINAIETFETYQTVYAVLAPVLGLSESEAAFLMDNPELANAIFDLFQSTLDEFGEEGLESVSLAAQLLIDLEQNDLISGTFDENTFLGVLESYTNDDPIGNAARLAYALSATAASLRLEHPNWPDWKIAAYAVGNVMLEDLHLQLDIIGLVPGAGEFADLANGAVYAVEGEWLDASLSLSSAIPFAGWFSTSAKWAKRAIPERRITLTWFKNGSEVIFASDNLLRKQLKRLLNTPAGHQAHHIVPLQWKNNPVVQQAAKGNADEAWHPNDILNGINLPNSRHNGYHGNYNTRVQQKLDEINNNYNGNITPQQAWTEINLLMDDIREAIIDNPNTHINDLIF